MADLSPTMERAVDNINTWFSTFRNITYMVGDCGVRLNTALALEGRGMCKVTVRTLNDEYIDVKVIEFKNWHPGVLDRLAEI